MIELTFSYTRALFEFTENFCPNIAAKLFHVDQPEMIMHVKIISCHYDGPDLERVERHCCTPINEVIARYSNTIYRVHFLGFAPDLPNVSGPHPRLVTLRLDPPRSVIRELEIKIGDAQTGIYLLSTPDSWNLIASSTISCIS
ncbi:MAG TPA: hypothetical protein DDW21_02310 [Verrucomicrobiales bacterium]|nr:MAG: hypothetical protein B9S37_08020 [Verrucomicrobiae bacterium Tous-C3TDCM]PAZ05304.1 MAG: hypothetical protein CAK88_09520 [Verrucomicrobiae bacterium AMD-G2]HBE22293.1 hypothetical protein [Verrucomicrobiales bacterium]